MPAAVTRQIAWLTAGGFAHRPAGSVWLFLGIAVAGGLLIVTLSYAFTLTRIGPARRFALGGFRLAMWCALLAMLAAPMRIERTFDRPPGPRPLAVLVDRSASMTIADNRGQRRLDDALHHWQRLQPVDARPSLPIKFFAFAAGLAQVAAADSTTALPDDRTDLFAALAGVFKQAPAGSWNSLVTLTDGLDTSGTDAAEGSQAAIQAALDSHTPLYFVVGHNRSVPRPFFHLRDFTAPAEATPHTVIHLQAVFESYRVDPGTVAVRLLANGRPQPSPEVPLDPGRHVETWTVDHTVEGAGTLQWELRAGGQVARAETRVIAPERGKRILYYEGALDWGYRFLGAILQRDDRFRVVPIFDFPQSGIALPPGAIKHPPFTAAGLEPYAIVILANVSPRQISANQQAALSAWVRRGGVLLFLTPDDLSAHGFADSELEKVLPVVFTTAAPQSAASALDRETGTEGPSKLYTVARRLDLTPFVWSDPRRAQEIFGATPEATLADQTPRFANFAHVERAKPGAEVLARHPTQVGPDGQGYILLALQRYGAGRSVVFTTDALWRWKLGQPSQDRGAELFWENLFSWLLHDLAPGMHFDHAPVLVPLGREVTLHLAGTSAPRLRVEATLDGRSVPVVPLLSATTDREFRWRPAAAGLWAITAQAASGPAAHAWISVEAPRPETGERSGAPPDEELLQRLADATGGAILGDVAPLAWTPPAPHRVLALERREPLWHRSWIFALLLGLYGIELLLRRRWNLL